MIKPIDSRIYASITLDFIYQNVTAAIITDHDQVIW